MPERPPERCWILWLPGQRPRSRNLQSKIPALSVAKETGRLAPSASLSEHEIQTRQRKGREERIGEGGLTLFLGLRLATSSFFPVCRH